MNYQINELLQHIKMPYPDAIKEFPTSMQIVIKMIFNRIASGKNAMIVIVGQTGGGKSLASIQFTRGLYLYKYGKEPTNEYLLSHIYFKASEFMEEMQKISNEFEQNRKSLRKEAHTLDEAGIDLSHKDFYTTRNKIMGFLAQTFRNLQQVVIFTLPSISMIDATIRKLLHYYFEVVHIDKKKKVCVVKPLQMQYNPRMDKTYYHNFSYPTNEGIVEVNFMGVPKISDELEDLYERRKAQFTGELNRKITNMLNRIEEKDNGLRGKKLTERQKRILELLKQGVSSTNEIAKICGFSASKVSDNLKYMRNKGIDIDSYRKKGKFTNFTRKPDAST